MLSLRMNIDPSGIAIHGTDDIASITLDGTNKSSGCVRMLPADIASLSAYNDDKQYTGILVL